MPFPAVLMDLCYQNLILHGKGVWTTERVCQHHLPLPLPPPPTIISLLPTLRNLRRKSPSNNKPSRILAHGLLALAVLGCYLRVDAILLSSQTHF